MTEKLNVQFLTPEQGSQMAAEGSAHVVDVNAESTVPTEATIMVEGRLGVPHSGQPTVEGAVATGSPAVEPNGQHGSFAIRDKRHSAKGESRANSESVADNRESDGAVSGRIIRKTSHSDGAEVSNRPDNPDKEAQRAKRLAEVAAREKLMKGMDPERWEARMKGKSHVDTEALKQQWAEEDAQEAKDEQEAAANTRIGDIIAAKKFQLGSRAVERGGIEDELYKDAIAQAAREGHDVQHLFERGAESRKGGHRQEDLRPAGISENDWLSMSPLERARVKIFMDQQGVGGEATPSGTDESLDDLRPAGMSEEDWAQLSDDEKRDLLSQEPFEPSDVSPVPVEDTSPKGLKERMLHLMRKAQANMWMLSSGLEKNRSRKKIVAWVAGGIAVAAAVSFAVLEAKGHGTGHAHTTPIVPGSHGSGGGGGGGGAIEQLQAANLSLGHHGDTIWTEVVGFATSHGVKLDEEHKRQVVDAVLKANGQTWESARDLPVGYRFHIPPDILEHYLKIKKP